MIAGTGTRSDTHSRCVTFGQPGVNSLRRVPWIGNDRRRFPKPDPGRDSPYRGHPSAMPLPDPAPVLELNVMADRKQPKLISQLEAADRLGLLDPRNLDRDWKRTILTMMRRGQLDGRLVGRTKFVREDSLTQFILSGRGA